MLILALFDTSRQISTMWGGTWSTGSHRPLKRLTSPLRGPFRDRFWSPTGAGKPADPKRAHWTKIPTFVTWTTHGASKLTPKMGHFLADLGPFWHLPPDLDHVGGYMVNRIPQALETTNITIKRAIPGPIFRPDRTRQTRRAGPSPLSKSTHFCHLDESRGLQTDPENGAFPC